MRMIDIIEKKKNGMSLSANEIKWMVSEFTKGNIPDYQMSAFAMAVYFQGMTDDEIGELTFAMAKSGDSIDLSMFGELTVDKHSTGGVGDKTTLIITPIVASLGAKVAKMSGRGLGHTGGTIDKLESIPGYRVSISNEEFISTVSNIGMVIAGATGNLAPADKKLYALRDVTSTVDCIPLIASSVMSKKIASGARSIVIDVKCGSGAFMKEIGDARLLAEKIVAIGKHCGRKITAIITDMDIPLGNNIGNALEVREAISVLKGNGPSDLRMICIELASQMLSLVFGGDWHDKVIEAIDSGKAYTHFIKWIEAQGGNLDMLPVGTTHSLEIRADRNGFIERMDSEIIGKTAMILGAGRSSVADKIDYASGITLSKKTGDQLSPGDILATLYTNDGSKLTDAEKLFRSAITITDIRPSKRKIILDIIK